MENLFIILLSGKMYSGKTTFCDYLNDTLLKENLPHLYFERISFARKLKDIAFSFGWNGIKDEKGRRLLQNIGKVGREYNINIWVDYVLKYITQVMKYQTENLGINNFVFSIDDFRFPNEFYYLYENIEKESQQKSKFNFMFYTIRINYENHYNNDIIHQDESETALDSFSFDFIINRKKTDTIDIYKPIVENIILKEIRSIYGI